MYVAYSKMSRVRVSRTFHRQARGMSGPIALSVATPTLYGVRSLDCRVKLSPFHSSLHL
jgi:hypothetical protein